MNWFSPRSAPFRPPPISENTLNAALRRLRLHHRPSHVPWIPCVGPSLLNESGRWDPDAIEAELGHVGADQIRKAYHRALYWEERVKMAQWWAEWVKSMLR